MATAQILGQKLGQTQLVSIPSAVKQEETVCGAERIGIVYPVYMFGLPLLVARFAESLKVTRATAYIFAVATCGGSSGEANQQLQEILQKNGIDLSASFAVRMPGNYTPLYGGPEAKTAAKIIDKAAAKTNQIAAQIIKQEKILTNSAWPLRILGRLFYKIASPQIPLLSQKFTVSKACKACGICARICPVENIYIQNGQPRWLYRCEHCLACLHWCPDSAIQWGRKTKGRRRYHHPAVNIRDIEQAKN
ncbi:hypothetical protein NO2_0474 [Candidatus Termititenax persephonae]|uniref:4Fe-4S ferredoxin-type domain-containing protein n=1 Tax=Candidatus Termititenax persephonae TaxID=2218525 RepID=A0A388TFL5_9BACT|nr:hypothetical protein NO2_0474 [Candidatus Termititenax persephonae]